MTQCKDVPTEAVLEWLRQQERPATWWDAEAAGRMPTVLEAMPEGTPGKVALAKMRKLIKAGLVEGCGCGCRGDFTLSEAGRAG